MKLKGTYASGTTYAVGDIVKYEDGFWYYMIKSYGSAGCPPTETEYWNMKDPTQFDLLDVINDVLGDVDTLNPDPKYIVLASSSSSSTKKFKISVVDNGTISASEVS